MRFRIRHWSQWFAAVNVFLLTMTMGLSFGWISPFLGNLSRPNPHFKVTKDQTTWIASLISMSQPIGIILGSIMANNWGSKISTHASGAFFISAWLLLILAKSVYQVFASLTFLGIGIGIMYTIYPIYMSEISDSKIRGALVSFVIHGVTIGMLMGNLLGAIISPTTFGVINFAIMFVCIISFTFVPSTPQYLISRKKMEEAEKSVKWYNQDMDPSVELKKISDFLETSPPLPLLKSIRELMTPVNLKALMIICMIEGFSQLFGAMTIMSYAEVIFIGSKVVMMNPATLVIILTGITIPVGWLSMYTTDKFGRIIMLFISYLLICMAFMSWGVNFLLLEKGYDEPNFQWISIISAVIFRFGIYIGLFPIAPTLIGELYAPNIKSIGCCVHNIFTAICMFISSKNFQFLVDNLTYKYTFLLFAVFMFLIGLCVRIFVPETKGKTLQEIQEMLNKVKKPNDRENQLGVETQRSRC